MTSTTFDRETLEWALADADIPVLLMVLVHLTGDRRWMEAPYLPKRDIRLHPDESGGLPDEIQTEVRAAVLAELVRASHPAPLDATTYAEMMSVCVGEPVGAAYVPLFLEEMGVVPSMPTWSTDPPTARRKDWTVLIVGAGLSGLCAAIQLQRAGIDHLVVDKNAGIGGTWWENTYPESGVDTPNHFYSYSFRPNPGWTSYFSKQPEVLAYIEDCADAFGVRDRIRLQTTVIKTVWDDEVQRWFTTVENARGEREIIDSNAVVTAVGQLNRPAIPDFPGLDSFRGQVFHTAQWRHDVDLDGARVAIVGVGASAMQIARSTAARAAHLTIFQRSPQWVAPNRDYHRRVSEQKLWLLANVPFYAQWYRFVIFWRYGDGLHRSLFVDPEWHDPQRSLNKYNDRHRKHFTDYLLEQLGDRQDLVDKTLPDYPPYGKRMLVDNGWFETLRRDDVDLVTDDIVRITPDGIVTSAGEEIPVDVIVMATGFHARRIVWPINVVASRTLAEAWADDDAKAYLGITVPGFPNFFLMHGPNTALAHGGSVIFHSECQARYVVDLLIQMIERGVGSAECREDVHDAYVAEVDAAHAQMVWTHPGMTNWYRNAKGRIVSTSPWTLVDYWTRTHAADLGDYVVTFEDDVAARRAEPAA